MVYLMANNGPQKFMNLATPLEEEGRFCNIMGASLRHQIYLTLPTIVRSYGQKLSGGKTTYHILI